VNGPNWERAKHIIAETLLSGAGSSGAGSATDWDPAEAKRIFCDAVDLPPARRADFIRHECAARASLARQVDSMLREFEGGSRFLAPTPATAPIDTEGGLAGDFMDTARFDVRRQLGSGSFGAVYEAWDRERRAGVALKVLHSRRPDLLFRFKREFRALATVSHPNLARLYELFADGDRWFFSMELVSGVNLLAYVRRANGFDVDRVRAAFAQLVEGVRALHQSRRIHRDLKPANALVTPAGRVVILDFGLVRETDGLDPDITRTQIVGTPAYMAPEQLLEGRVVEASDWYAVGVMLFEALTGALPHQAAALRRASAGVMEALAGPRQIDPTVPADLDELCMRLLSPRPEDRPAAAAIVAALASPTPPSVPPPSEAVPEADLFVGRDDCLRTLAAAFDETRQGALSVVLLHGRSGIGKTALANRFLSSLRKNAADAIVLKGKCYEFESVPYKGLDALVDELSRYLERAPNESVEALLPRDATLLPKLFPVLGRVRPIAGAPMRAALVPDAQELRQRTFSALRELLARLGDRHPLVVWIDDLQWSDRDSATFLAELCSPPNPPPLLLLLTYRSEELASNQTLAYLHQILANQRTLGGLRDVPLSELSREESERLVTELVHRDVSDLMRHKIVSEAAGHPLFLQQLARFATTHVDDVVGRLALRGLLQERIGELPPFDREVLELACVAAQPLTAAVLFETAASCPSDMRAETLARLVQGNFARIIGVDAERRVEPYHDQVRSAVVDALSPDARSARHRQLASALAQMPGVEPQVLVTHYREAGDRRAAFTAALQAAAIAETQLAFERAAELYQIALDTDVADEEAATLLYKNLARTLGMAGRGRDSAVAYLKAADASGAGERLDLQCQAAGQWMRSGCIDEALTLFERLAREFGVHVPATPAQAVRGIVWNRIRTRLTLLFGVPAPRDSTVTDASARRLDLLHTGGVILNIADPVLATYFQTVYIRDALRTGGDAHRAIALALEASVRLAGGKGRVGPAMQLIRDAERLAEASGNVNALGLILLLRAYVDYLLCRVPEGIKHSEQAIAFLRERCSGVAWELTGGYVLLFWFLCWAGYVEGVRNELPRLLKEGAARGDVNMEVSLRLLSYVHYSFLSVDQASEYIAEARTAVGRWSTRGYHLQTYGAMFGIVESFLYLGDYDHARNTLMDDWDRMTRSFILRWQTLLVMALFLRGRVALAGLVRDPGSKRLQSEVAEYAARLDKIGTAWCRPMAKALRGGVALARGSSADAASLLEAAAEEFEGVSLHAYAAAARHFSGRLSGGDHGRALMTAAAAFVTSQRVVRPDAFLNMLLPGSA
jgi:serine/threonine protein kinase/tetratricopeptide (TPR) repeat protein